MVQRARGTAGVPIATLTAFAKALAPFEPTDPAAAVSTLVARLDAPPVPAPVPVPVPVPMRVPIAPTVALAGPARPAAAAVPAAPKPPIEAVADIASAAPVWRPARWQVAGVLAATVLAAILGATIGRRDHLEPVRQQPSPSTRTATVHPSTRPPEPEPELVAPSASTPAAPERQVAGPAITGPAVTEPAVTGPAVQPVPGRPDTPAPTPAFDDGPSPAVTAHPARLVDHRTVQADAVFSPSFAANGSAVFFHAESGSGSALKRAEPGDHGELRVATIVDDGARNYHVQLSPDGTQVAFDSDRDGERGVYLADANGRGVRRISGPGYAAVPTWAPDGRRLAFLRAEADRPAVWNLWLLDRDSGAQTRLTGFRQGQVWGGAWFSDGRRLAYSHEDRLTIRDLASGQSREFASPLPRRLVRTPAVSPDGRWIMFQVYRDGAWLLDVERGVMQRVLEDPSAEEFAWSPDGHRVAYHSQRSGGWNLWTMAAP
jgi:hypothetical protein